ncbi:MAG: OmpA family protein [Flavobacteriales bacterium]|nr:OmpA family protein [Flavobacteriales bacterium]
MKNLITSILLLGSLPTVAQTYEVLEVDITAEAKPLSGGLNTRNAEFSPYVLGDIMYFTSSREFDMTTFGENNWKNSGYLNVFQTKIKGEINEDSKMREVALVSQKIQTTNHTGPMSLSASGDTIFFTQVDGSSVKSSKKNKLKPQLFMAVRSGSSWSDPKKLAFNNKDYSFGHPCYDSKAKRLYFASDMKGGKGGKDIYYTDLKNGQWSRPKNLEVVNTSSDELFPFVQDGVLFFSSNRSGGKGKLDIYWKLLQSNKQPASLEGLNTDSDDFGIFVFPGMTKGFFSSNRPDAKGKEDDDVYFLYMEKKITIKNEMAGQFTYRNINGQASGLKIMILGEEDEILFETTTDQDGNFTFKNIDYQGDYRIKPVSEDEMELTLFDADGNPIANLMSDENHEFTYKKLKFKEAGYLSLIPEDMIDLELNTGHLSGQFIYEDVPGKYPSGLEVKLRDEKGNVMLSTTTDERGNFDFRQLDMAKNYLLNMNEMDEDLVLLIYDSSGNVVAQLKSNEDGDFIYRKLDPSISNNLSLIQETDDLFTMETQTVSGYFEFKKLKGLANDLTVLVYDEEGFKLGEVTTDEKGHFRFRNLPVQNNLLFKIDESDPDLKLDDFTLFIFDRYGKKVASLKRGQNGFFIYKPLGFDDTHNLSHQNDSIDFSLTIDTDYDIITVYYGSNQTNVLSKDIAELNKLAKVLKAKTDLKVEINAYADARSSDEYNLELSRRRGDWVVNYLKKKGINKNRFIVNAYGESRLASESNDALNRRAEIRIY